MSEKSLDEQIAETIVNIVEADKDLQESIRTRSSNHPCTIYEMSLKARHVNVFGQLLTEKIKEVISENTPRRED